MAAVESDEKGPTVKIEDIAMPYRCFLKQYSYVQNTHAISSSKTVYKVRSLNEADIRTYFIKKRTFGQNTDINRIAMEHKINNHGISTKYIQIYYDEHSNVYILMKLLDFTLGEMILSHRNHQTLHKLNESHSRFLAKCIATELSKLHKLGYVHGDIKPHNIMYDKELKTWHLIDFDLSVANQTVKKHYFGTCSWSAIEHLYDSKQDYLYTNKCDVFTFGLIIVYSLFGTQPFATWDKHNLQLLTQTYSAKARSKKKYFQHCELLKLYHPAYAKNAVQKLKDKIASYNMSKDLTDLIQQMLFFDPQKRIGIESVMNHSWFNGD